MEQCPQCLNDYHAVVFFKVTSKNTETDIYTVQRYLSLIETNPRLTELVGANRPRLTHVEFYDNRTIDGVTGDFICLSFKCSSVNALEEGDAVCFCSWDIEATILAGTGCFCSQCEVKGIVRPWMETRTGRRVLVDFHQQLKDLGL
jgi:hypothetical protein